MAPGNHGRESAAIPPLHALGYVRVSTTDQARHGFSLDDQERELTRIAERNGWSLRIHREAGRSGETLEGRPEMLKVLAAVEAGEGQAVLVVDESRLSREELTGAIIRHRLRKAGTLLVTKSGTRNLSDPSDSFVAGILGQASAYEQALRTAKTKAGVRAAAEAGYWTGGNPPFGLRTVAIEGSRHKRLAIDESEAETIRLAVSFIVDEGLSTWDTAARLNALGRLTRTGVRWSHNRLRLVLVSS